MAEDKIWLNVSVSNNLAEIRRVKILITDEDYERAFISLKESCSDLVQKNSSLGSEEIPEFVVIYKPEEGLQEENYFFSNWC